MMKKLILVLFAAVAFGSSARAESVTSPPAPCATFGTIAGTCLQGPVSGTGSPALETDGTFTPTDASGASLTFTTATGFYRKVGKTVLIWGFITYPATVSSAQATIGSLPFTASNTSTNLFPSINLFGIAVSVIGLVTKNGVTFAVGGAATGAAVPNSSYNLGVMYFSGTYPTDN